MIDIDALEALGKDAAETGVAGHRIKFFMSIDPESVLALIAEVRALREAIKRQASAARMGMDAAKAGGAIMLELATQARAESSPEVLASERAMNATLTEEVERLTVDRDHWKANHDNQVSRARFLIERGDIPIERVRAYQTFGALLALEEAVRAHRAMYEGTSDEDNMSALSIGDAISQLDAARKEKAC